MLSALLATLGVLLGISIFFAIIILGIIALIKGIVGVFKKD
jgi:hypothetical protein